MTRSFPTRPVAALALWLAALVPAPPAQAQVLNNNSPTIRDDLCVGVGCADNEPYFLSGRTRLRLSGFNTSIEFRDNSTATGMPSVDWTLQANSTATNGSNYMSFNDVFNGSVPFKVESSFQTNNLVVAGNGNIGMGTGLPATDLHIAGGATPTIRLQSGFTGPYDWDIASNNVNWFVRNDTRQVIPFLIRAGAGSSSLVIDDTDNIGMGTGSPAAALHLRRYDNSAAVLIEDSGSGPLGQLTLRNNGGTYLTLDNTDSGTTWFFTHEDSSPNRFIIADAVADGPELTLTAGGDLTIPGQLFTGGSCGAGCDRVFDADYPLPTIPQQAAMMMRDRHLPNVGPTPEDGPFNITAMTGGMLNELEKAHLYIAQLESRLSAIEARLAQHD